MKTKILYVALVLSALATSCSKDSSSPEPTPTGGGGGTPPPTTTYVIAKDSSFNGNDNDTRVRVFNFNSNKKLVTVKYKYGTNLDYYTTDTISYNASGKVSKVETYNFGNPTPEKSNIYNYSGTGELTSINESGLDNGSGPYVRTRSFTYSGGKLSGQNVTYISGNAPNDGGPEAINSILYSGNNMSSASMYFDMGSGLQWYPITLTSSTTASNPYYGLNYESDDFLNMFNPNNILKVYLTQSPTIIFVDYSYTYANGRVASYVDNSRSPVRTTIISYQGL